QSALPIDQNPDLHVSRVLVPPIDFVESSTVISGGHLAVSPPVQNAVNFPHKYALFPFLHFPNPTQQNLGRLLLTRLDNHVASCLVYCLRYVRTESAGNHRISYFPLPDPSDLLYERYVYSDQP